MQPPSVLQAPLAEQVHCLRVVVVRAILLADSESTQAASYYFRAKFAVISVIVGVTAVEVGVNMTDSLSKVGMPLSLLIPPTKAISVREI